VDRSGLQTFLRAVSILGKQGRICWRTSLIPTCFLGILPGHFLDTGG